MQTSFFAIEYLLSRVVDVATLCFICSRTLADRKMSKFLINTQKLLIVKLMNGLKNIFNSHEDTMSHIVSLEMNNKMAHNDK